MRRTAVAELNGPAAKVVYWPKRGEVRLLVGVPRGTTLNRLNACPPSVKV
jgi:hypothetical protein